MMTNRSQYLQMWHTRISCNQEAIELKRKEIERLEKEIEEMQEENAILKLARQGVTNGSA